MRKYIILIAMLGLALGLKAQTGIFDIAFDQSWPHADSLLAEYGFYTKNVELPMVKYYPNHRDPMIEAIILFVEPTDYKIVGWFVKHWASLEEEDDNVVLERLYEMHGEAAHYDKETEQLIWILSPSRSIHMLYVSDSSLCVFYQDSNYQELFELNKKLADDPEEEE